MYAACAHLGMFLGIHCLAAAIPNWRRGTIVLGSVTMRCHGRNEAHPDWVDV